MLHGRKFPSSLPLKSPKKDINTLLFNLSGPQTKFLYFFNLALNTIFRISLFTLLVLHIVEDKRENTPVYIIIGLEGLCILLYFIAITKMLYTKSN